MYAPALTTLDDVRLVTGAVSKPVNVLAPMLKGRSQTLGGFNLENLFTRPAAMNQETDAEGREAIEDHVAANAIAEKMTYSAADKAKLLELTAKYKWHNKNPPKNALV